MNSRDKLRLNMLSSISKMLDEKNKSSLRDLLKKHFPWVSFTPILNWVPEQAEDIYWILIDLERIAILEIPRSSHNMDDATVDVINVNSYMRKRISAETKQNLDVAIELMSEHLSR
ncbi:hypothetical protein ALQ08_200114 [Pseudomonas syringae pv. delphinii]|uniref:Uncharacterized protein n=1 Tax=Pseudomonas syringae pv. delphinii TaxID=192088 RepID=A0A0P9PWL9_9PSED|nr:hypothetical protein [Pseudomonas syringae group genomosp. 3]KPX25325.1 hypothetical protein ALO72_200094 [Pseudomonas syringae pv. delphinii]RMP09416.1 hypothetical protein ALQ28_200027 [Pseudomonas syringae pv. delphinii]RMP23079.1 hypothetical protein ALQ27_200145 [Pseudomonas syringae pv. delphinii]RMQ20684.1 hypothetical protein ALQ08_200114 [Pseudomonas syringae pv. delphinii]